MSEALVQARRNLAARVVGERRIPVGGSARDRRLLRRALRGLDTGRVLVIGPDLPARQALPGSVVDVASPQPLRSVTVCSTARGPASLPHARWDTVIVTDPQLWLEDRIVAIRTASRPGARLLVVDRRGRLTSEDFSTSPNAPAVERLLSNGRDTLWVLRWRR